MDRKAMGSFPRRSTIRYLDETGRERTLRLDEIPVALQGAWVQQLRRFYDLYNANYVKGSLRRPLFRLGESSERLGQWDGSFRTITISVRHILAHPWESVLETLRHEMAHQYAEEVLGRRGEPPHGDAFREAAHLLRVPPRGTAPAGGVGSGSGSGSVAGGGGAGDASSGEEGSLEGLLAQRDRILDRVKLLLALAKSPNEHEAANAMRMANKYLLEYNLDLSRDEGERRYATRHLGRISGRIQEYEYVLGQLLQDHFFVCVIWTWSYDALLDRPGRALQICGTPENLEMAEYVYHYVLNVAERLWVARRRSPRAGAPGHGAPRGGVQRGGVQRAAGGTRLQYMAGLVRGLKEKLEAQRVELKEERGLVWLGDKGLSRYHRYINPYIRSTATSGVARGDRYHEGLRDGREITIHKGVGGAAVRGGRMLPGS
jgi:hypothetical protein